MKQRTSPHTAAMPAFRAVQGPESRPRQCEQLRWRGIALCKLSRPVGGPVVGGDEFVIVDTLAEKRLDGRLDTFGVAVDGDDGEYNDFDC
jgi:hypothetical protein